MGILTLSCYATDIDEFRNWRNSMLGVYGSPTAMVVEIGCNGPIKWTKTLPILKTLSGVDKIKQESRLLIDLRSYRATSAFYFLE